MGGGQALHGLEQGGIFMIKGWRELKMDWKENMLLFMKVAGEGSGDWYPERWERYGIKAEDAKIILREYEKRFSED